MLESVNNNCDWNEFLYKDYCNNLDLKHKVGLLYIIV